MREGISYLSSLITLKNTLTAAAIITLAGIGYCWFRNSKKSSHVKLNYNSGTELSPIRNPNEPSAFGTSDNKGGPLSDPVLRHISSNLFTEEKPGTGVVEVHQGQAPNTPTKK